MPAPKGSHNALKHGLYAKHFTRDVSPELARMPVDSGQMELAALRLNALRAMDLYSSTASLDEKAKAVKVAVLALEAAVNVIAREQILIGDAPVLKDLWDAISEANRIERLDKEI